jgi:hypothetical protein
MPQDSNEWELAVIIHAMPTQAAEGTQDGNDWLSFFLALAMFDGGGTAESAIGLDADDRVITIKIDPVSPSLGFVAGIQVFLAQGGKDFRHGGRWGEFGKSDEGFHG